MKRIVVVGGGVSGLAAANELAQNGHGVLLLEAKERLGGRVFTKRVGGQIVELGAEFVHGRNKSLLKALREGGLELTPASEQNEVRRAGKLEEVDIWGKAGEVIKRIEPKEPDSSFLEFLKSTRFRRKTKEMVIGFVEGFNATDAKKISAHALRRAEYSSGQEEGDRQARLIEGYQALVEDLARKAQEGGVEISLNCRVRAVSWRRGSAVVEFEKAGTKRKAETKAAIITLPLGVLKAGSVRFEPPLNHKREAIEELQFGNVLKSNFVFRKQWWRKFGFIHDFGAAVPTWWCDSRGPVIVGWVAGRRAEELKGKSATEIMQIGLETIGRIFRKPVVKFLKDLAAFELHDWSADEYARGAYTYLPVNGLDLPKLLGEPVDETLFFAGEATATDAQMGTVFGAMESGLRAAREVLRASASRR